MTPRLRYVLQFVVGLSLLAIGGLSAPHTLRAAGDTDACSLLRDWARDRYATSHLTLDDLAPYDRAHRLAIVSVLTPEVRAALWRTHLQRFSRRRDLSPAQRGLLRDATAVFTPALYAGDRESQIRAERFRADIERLFPSTAQKQAWSQLATIAPDGEFVLPPPTTSAQIPNCNCRTSADCVGQVCGGGPCNWVWACGAGGSQLCNGVCR